MSESLLNNSIQYIKSIGPKRAELFNKIGIETIRDLLFYFPTKYLDRSNILSSSKIISFIANGYEGEVTALGKVIDTETFHYGKKQIFKVFFNDATGTFECVWFQGIKFFKNRFKEGEFYAISSKPVLTKYGHLQFTHPDFDKLTANEPDEFMHTGKIIPFYTIPKQLKAGNVGDWSLRRIVHSAVEEYADKCPETLPEVIIGYRHLMEIREAIKTIHFPETNEKLSAAQTRFKYEELFYIETLVAMRKMNYKTKFNGFAFQVFPEPIKAFLKGLPFALTEDQLNVLSEIRKDLESKKPMNRLLQGDVGSGKTVVAVIAMLIASENKKQSVLMAPTEILAHQHYRKLCEYFSQFNIQVAIIIGGQKKSERTKNLALIESGKSPVIIGTHALFEETVKFKDLGLVVIDEQHRFGVVQKYRLIEKGKAPDILVMTATPIPRALSLTIYGDLDVSTIKHLPAGRKEISTAIRHEDKLENIYQFIIDKIKDGYQSYIVYPLVEESEKMDLKAAETYFESLSKTYFKNCKVGLIHGKMHWRDKEKIMMQFADKEFDILISTTVIEVGIDVADANIIVINDANRFGLSQLHQLRGRVGRSSKQAYCILISNFARPLNPDKFDFSFKFLSNAQIEKQKAAIRLGAMVKFSSGFKLSEIDFKLRGPGDIFGTKQSGFPDLKYADIVADQAILINAKEDAFKIIDSDNTLSKPEYQIIRKVLKQNYWKSIQYSQIA